MVTIWNGHRRNGTLTVGFGLALAALLGGCASKVGTGATGDSAAHSPKVPPTSSVIQPPSADPRGSSNRPMPGPTQQPCSFPSTVGDITSRLTPGMNVVDVTAPDAIPQPAETIDGGVKPATNEYDFSGSMVHKDFNGNLTSFAVNAADLSVKTGEEYILFVFPVPDQKGKSGEPLYGVADGYYGMFPIVDGQVSMVCPNYSDPGSPTLADGSGVDVDGFRSLIESAIQTGPSASPS